MPTCLRWPAGCSTGCNVLIGVPTYGAGFVSHNPRAENISIALKGVREGLADHETNLGSFCGIAVFADYTTGDDQWAEYEKLWPAGHLPDPYNTSGPLP